MSISAPFAHSRRAAALAAAVASLGAAALAAASPVTFRFSPPDKTTFVETTTSTATMSFPKMAKQSQQSELAERKTFARTADGFRVTSTRLSSKSLQNGKPVPDPVGAKLKGMTVTFVLDRTGKLKTVQGLDAAAKRLRDAMGPQLGKEHANALTEDALKRQATAEWAHRYGELLGRPVKLGQPAAGVEPFPLPTGGYAPVYSVKRYVSRPNFHGHDCLALRTDYNTDAAALAKQTGMSAKVIRAAKLKAAARVDTKSGAKVRGYDERILDPATLLSYAETSTRTVLLTIPQHQGVATATQTRTSTYRYGR